MGGLLTGKRAIVTGGGRGVGPTLARRLAEEGASVAVTYRGSKEGAETVVAEIRASGGFAVALQADLLDEDAAANMAHAAAEALEGLDILVNNAAGFGPAARLADSDWAHFAEEYEAVVRPTVSVTRAVLPVFLAQGSGRIVNLAATLLQRPAVGYGAHAMAKSAILAYTRTLAREVGARGVTVNVVSPGMTTTEYTNSLPETLRSEVAARTPLRRLAAPDDLAGAVLFFCSPLANFITGANLAPDGGLAIL